MKQKLFISYSHEDLKVVKQFAMQLSLRGFDLWMDEKNVSFGGNYTTAILQGIHEADVYLVFLSANSIKSRWVEAEIDFALKEKIERKMVIVPIRLDDSEVPVALSNIDYVDARFSVPAAIDEFTSRFAKEDVLKTGTSDFLDIVSISFEIKEKTAVEVGPFNVGVDFSDLEDNREQILKNLRKKAHGILMNFVSANDFDFQAIVPKFKNGMYEEDFQRIKGSTEGSVCDEVRVEAVVFNPVEKKVLKLLEERTSVLSINAVSFGFLVNTGEKETLLDIGKNCLNKLQEEYIILSYDNIEGAKVEIDEGCYLSFMPSDSVLKIRLSTKYDGQLENFIKKFSLVDFIGNLLDKYL